MTLYTVLLPRNPQVPGDPQADSDPMAAVFVKEGFSWPAFFFAPLWLIFRRLWLVLAGYAIAVLVVGGIGDVLGDGFTGPALVLLHFLFALEANELRRWTLARGGYRLATVVEGRGVEEAEIRYFASATAAPAEAASPPTSDVTPPAPPAPTPRPLGPIAPSAEAGDVIGLFPAPGART
jgi:hypothetical protein